ncbi:hypothetical protein M3Y98_01181500 [Aphelenchoides besseyi]|nr:hypothetical protein M3Y98_01181500 [Aphelenchoides besseyi]
MLIVALFLLVCNYVIFVHAVKCVGCTGLKCMTKACEGDICVSSFYAPKWNEVTWSKSRAVYGCLSGNMTTSAFRDHCETTTDELGRTVYSCVCQTPLCNGRLATKLPREEIDYVECNCEGRHCEHPTCTGRSCTYVVNHLTMQTERGCSNLSIPILDRRVSGSFCSIPPLTGSLHTNVARTGDDLLQIELCMCQTPYCNRDRPLIHVPKEMKCAEKIRGTFYGQKSNIAAEPSEFTVNGCISFANGTRLNEEFEPSGCAYFSSHGLRIRSCFETSDSTAINRARETRESHSETHDLILRNFSGEMYFVFLLLLVVTVRCEEIEDELVELLQHNGGYLIKPLSGEKPHKVIRKIDALAWSRKFPNKKGVAMGKRYIAVSFESPKGEKARFYVFFVQEDELDDAVISVQVGTRKPLDEKIEKLFNDLKAITSDEDE